MNEQLRSLYKQLEQALSNHHFNGVDNHKLIKQYIKDIEKLEKEEQ